MMNESLDIKLHFKCTVPVFKCKHCSPVKPEIRIKNFFIKEIFYCLIIQIFIFCEEKFHYLHTALLAKIELAVSMGIFASVYSCTAEWIVRIMLVKPVIFIKYRCSRYFNWSNTSEQIPETFKVVFHLTSATHYITSCWVINSVARTTGDIHSFKNMNIFALHLSISYKKTCSCKWSKSTSYKICTLVINTFRFFRPCKCFIITVWIVNTFTVLCIFATLCVPECIMFFFLNFFYSFFLLSFFALCCNCCNSCSNCYQRCHA